MVSLKQLVNEVLDDVNVFIDAIFGYAGSVFNDGDFAYFKVRVSNNTGMTLRDVVAQTYVYGAAEIEPIQLLPGIVCLDGEESWSELQPYADTVYYVRIKGISSGNAHIDVFISAEVVPYSRRYRAYRSISVTPS
jgi:hypothetical protein